jgi:hypothetical protein
MRSIKCELSAFKLISLLGSLLYFYLFVSLLVSPAEFFAELSIVLSADMCFIARRAGMLMLGFSALLFFARNAPVSGTRVAISAAVVLNMAGFASTGIHAYAVGLVDEAIFFSVVVEGLFVVLFSTCALSTLSACESRRLMTPQSCNQRLR